MSPRPERHGTETNATDQLFARLRELRSEFDRGFDATSLREAARLANQHPNVAAVVLEYALMRYARGEVTEAHRLLRQALHAEHRHAGSLYWLGIVDRDAGRMKSSRRHLAMAMGAGFDRYRVLVDRALCWYLDGRPLQAVTDFSMAARVRPLELVMCRAYGVALVECGNRRRGRFWIKRSIAQCGCGPLCADCAVVSDILERQVV